jgi:hypothetical protein
MASLSSLLSQWSALTAAGCIGGAQNGILCSFPLFSQMLVFIPTFNHSLTEEVSPNFQPPMSHFQVKLLIYGGNTGTGSDLIFC